MIEKLSVRAPPGDVKLKLMKDIAVEQNVDWDPTATESELLKAPEDLLVSVLLLFSVATVMSLANLIYLVVTIVAFIV